MISTTDFDDSSWRVGRGYLTMYEDGTGFFSGSLGMVRVYRDRKSTHLVTPHCGLMHSRYWRRRWGDKTISRLAKEFLTDVARRT